MVEAALAADSGVKILAVTVLTSMGDEEVSELGFQGTVEDLVVARAKKVLAMGCDGLVCSAREAVRLRKECGPEFTMVTPGIRPADTKSDDQKRVATPEKAIHDGADHLVIGRPIRDAEYPAATITAIQQEISAALHG